MLAQLMLGDGLPVRDQDQVLDGGQLAGELVEDRDQGLVDEEDLVLGIPDDELEVLRKEAQVEGVEHGAHGGDRVIELEVAVVVPAEGRDPVALADTEALQGARQLVDPGHHLAVGGAVDAALLLGDDLLPREEALDAPQPVLGRQLVVLHQTFHNATSGPKSSQFPAPLGIPTPSCRRNVDTVLDSDVHRCPPGDLPTYTFIRPSATAGRRRRRWLITLRSKPTSM